IGRPTISIQDIIQFSPNELVNSTNMMNEGTVKQLRANPSTFFSSVGSPLDVTEKQLKRAVLAHQQSNFVAAKRHAVSAYLDGFELVENTLDTKDTMLRKSIESELLGLRQILNAQTVPEQVKQSVSAILTKVTKAKRLLSESSMSDAALFSTSFIILLREGLEALLVVIALISILIRSNKREAMKYVHLGWMTAILAGIVTWLVAQYLVSISGASREIMEGIAALLASVVLFYVGFWMHSKTQADQWQLFIKRNINESLKAGTLWGITGLTFITVYREVFETVLFYQSLLTQAAASQEVILLAGFGSAVFILMLFAGLMIKYSIKLPIGKFFSVTTYILLTLSFVLAGKAVSALQEAAIIAISPFPMSFQIELLGINSTWQGVSLQLSILVLTILLITRQRLRTRTQTSIKVST
ncbi:MAG: iron permease, partial [Gammaproteobacteria bacterium]